MKTRGETYTQKVNPFYISFAFPLFSRGASYSSPQFKLLFSKVSLLILLQAIFFKMQVLANDLISWWRSITCNQYWSSCLVYYYYYYYCYYITITRTSIAAISCLVSGWLSLPFFLSQFYLATWPNQVCHLGSFTWSGKLGLVRCHSSSAPGGSHPPGTLFAWRIQQWPLMYKFTIMSVFGSFIVFNKSLSS